MLDYQKITAKLKLIKKEESEAYLGMRSYKYYAMYTAEYYELYVYDLNDIKIVYCSYFYNISVIISKIKSFEEAYI